MKCRKCKGFDRVVHSWCCRKLKLVSRNFECKHIQQQLVPVELGSRKVARKEATASLSLPARFFCLVCGEQIAEWEPEFVGKKSFLHEDVVICSHSKDVERPCEFGVHKQCMLMHDKWLLGKKESDASAFECNAIQYNIDQKTVNHLAQKRLKGRQEKIRNLKEKNKIRDSNDKRKRRYTNPNNFCKYCCQEIPREQKNHLMQHCSGLSTTPVIRSDVVDLRATARRCLEIACAGKLKLKPSSVRKRKWGELDGESLAELTPKRHRGARSAKRTNIMYNGGHAARPPFDPGGTG